MTPEAWRQRAEGRELCDCGEWDEEHGDQCHDCGDLFVPGHVHQIGRTPKVIPQAICRDGSGEFRRARRSE